uniref:SSD domain-containing protein n=2 Tax=Bursaphelenchus xylophilus TaxID=6326 RepID=A0A1I7SM66_BURXY
MMGVCRNEAGLSQNCPYSSAPMPFESVDTESQLRQICPRLFENNSTVSFCCDEKQFKIFQKRMEVPRQMLSRCPSCLSNFMNLWCQFTCSPYQSHFVRLLETGEKDKFSIKNSVYVKKVEYYVDEDYANGVFESCKGVRMSTGDFALKTMCGTDFESCTADKWFNFLGRANKNLGIPFDIRFSLTKERSRHGNKTFDYMQSRAYPCNSSSDLSSSPCSCQECNASCVEEPMYPDLESIDCKIATMDCQDAFHLAILGFICACLMVGVAGKYVWDLMTRDDNDNIDGEIKKRVFSLDRLIQKIFISYAKLVMERYTFIFFIFLVLGFACSFGLLFVNLTTETKSLWTSPASSSRLQESFFENNFKPFHRIEQVIITPKDTRPLEVDTFESEDNAGDPDFLGPVFRDTFFKEAFSLNNAILRLQTSKNVSLEDVCYKPLEPDNKHCAVMSPFNYFQNDLDSIDGEIEGEFAIFNFRTHLQECIKNPFSMKTSFKMSCFGQFGGPIHPYLVFGDFNDGYESAKGIMITILLNNSVKSEENRAAMEWEETLIKYLKRVKSDIFRISFMSQRSIEDEISRQASSDVIIVALSYVFLLFYVSFALSQYQVPVSDDLCTILINTKLTLGFVGIIGIALAVTSAVGICSYWNIETTLIVFEILPFLIVSVGVDNIFLFVQAYQRRDRHDIPLNERVCEIAAEVMPSMLLTSTAEAICFSFGAISEMPAVRTFSLFAAISIITNFILQITLFFSAFVWDAKRQEEGRLDMLCCIKLRPERPYRESYMYNVIKNFIAPSIIIKPVRIFVLILFLFWFATSLLIVDNIQLGLDQKRSVPDDSHVYSYFRDLEIYVNVGPPVFFVLRGSFDYGDPQLQNLICTGNGCHKDSLGAQINRASRHPELSNVAHPVMNWLDDYIEWLRPSANGRCCRRYDSNHTFCPSLVPENLCHSCGVDYVDGRPRPDLFYTYIKSFLSSNPSVHCPTSGHALYSNAIKFASKSDRIIASHFMTYHTPFRHMADYFKSMESAKFLANNITKFMNTELGLMGHPPIDVFPYSFHYVFYEQYETIVKAAIFQLICSAVSIFIVAAILCDMDPWSAMIITITVVMSLINQLAMMYFLNIDFNAISVVNLIMSVGISLEYSAHTVRAFVSIHNPSRIERAKESLALIGCTIISGITTAKGGSLLIILFSHSKIFNVYYFRMFASIIMVCFTHGLILLPVLLSFIGPPPSKNRPDYYGARRALPPRIPSLIDEKDSAVQQHLVAEDKEHPAA